LFSESEASVSGRYYAMMTTIEAVVNLRPMASLQKARDRSQRLWDPKSPHAARTPTGEAEDLFDAPLGGSDARQLACKLLREAIVEAEAYSRHMERREGEGDAVAYKASMTLSLSREPVRVKTASGEWVEPPSMALHTGQDITWASPSLVKELGLVPEATDHLVLRGPVGGGKGGAQVSALSQSPSMLQRVWLDVEVKGHQFSVLGAVAGEAGIQVGGDIINSLFAQGYSFGTGAVPAFGPQYLL